jgi:hypothetical protein
VISKQLTRLVFRAQPLPREPLFSDPEINHFVIAVTSLTWDA